MSDGPRSPFSGNGLKARALRGTALTLVSVVGSNLLRLGSNLILTRILFPEAFGLMALVQVFLGGLEMFSDIGVRTSILQSKRGDDPDFLNTAWTIQVMRGVGLWLVACALAPVAAWIYDQPLLLLLLPVAAFREVIAGFTTTNIASANRHLKLGIQTFAELGCQAFGIGMTILLAILLQSVWAIVIAGLFAATFRVLLFHRIMPGIRNRFRWDPASLGELFQFGKWIFLSTVMGFLINQSDRAVLGAQIPLAELGVYHIGLFMGTLPLLLSRVAARRVVLPLYRMRPPSEGEANRRRMFRARRLMVGTTLAIATCLAFVGVPLIEFLYDPRYALAGPMVVLFGLALVPQLVLDGYTGALLGQGDSRSFFVLLAVTAVIQLGLMFALLPSLGVIAAIIAPGLAMLAAYPLRIQSVRRHKAWDARGDLAFLSLGLSLNGLAVWLHWDDILRLLPAAAG